MGLATYGEVRRKGLLLLGSMLAFAVLLVLFAYSPLYWPAVGVLLVAGVLNSLFGASIATLLQTNAGGRMRGRVMSLYTITIIGVPSLGALGTASVAEAFGARHSVGIAAGLLAVLSLGLLVGGRTVRSAGERAGDYPSRNAH